MAANFAVRPDDGRLRKKSADDSAKAADGEAKALGKSFGAWGKVTGAAKAFGGGIKGITPAIGALGGSIVALATGALPNAQQAMTAFGQAAGEAATGGATKLAGALAMLGPEGAAAGAAVEVLAGGFAALVGTMTTVMGLAISLSEKFGMMRDRFAALSGSVAGGKAVQGVISQIAATTPFATSQVSAWAQSMLAAGVHGNVLADSIRGVAAAQALMGDSGAAGMTDLITKLAAGGQTSDKMMKAIQAGGPKAFRDLKQMGLSTHDLAKAMGLTDAKFKTAKLSAEQLQKGISKAMSAKGAGPLADMMLTFPSILGKAQEGFMSLFQGVNVKPFMSAIKELFGQFSKGTGPMKALKGVFGDVFSTIFKYATMAVKAVSKFVKENFTAKNVKSTWTDIKSAIGTVVMVLGKVWAFLKPIFTSPAFIRGLGIVFKFVAIMVGIAVTALGIGIAVLGTIGGVIADVIGTVASFGSSIVDGLMNFDGSKFIEKMKGLAAQGLAAFKSILGIASPSKVMMQMGGHVATGAAEGVDKGTAQVADSASNMGKAMAGGAAGGAKGGKGGAKGKGGITINGGVHIEVPHGTPSAWAEEAFAAFMERLAASQGA